MLSPTGRCRTFDVSADGYVRGEGCGVLYMRPRAEAEDWPQLGSVAGFAVNQDGRTNGLVAPNGPSQTRLLLEAQQDSGLLSAEQVDAVECHGTGTSLGDPIEIGALANCFQGRARPLLLGTGKVNLGHCETAAGMVGVLKVLLSLRNSLVPQHLHFSTLNPFIGEASMQNFSAVVPLDRQPTS